MGIHPSFIIALHSSGEAVGRLTKRNGYSYKPSSSSSSLGSSHGGSALFIPQESHSAPDHEITYHDAGGGSGSGGDGPVNSKYDDTYYDYKIASSASGGPSASYHLSGGGGGGVESVKSSQGKK